MTIKPIAYSYWRRIKDDARKFASVPDNVKADVRTLAEWDVEKGEITPERFQELIEDAAD